jgi:hypothetical protein
VANTIAHRAYTARLATVSVGRCGSKIGPISEREAPDSSGATIAAATTMTPTPLIRTIIHGRISSTPIPSTAFSAFGRQLIRSKVLLMLEFFIIVLDA